MSAWTPKELAILDRLRKRKPQPETSDGVARYEIGTAMQTGVLRPVGQQPNEPIIRTPFVQYDLGESIRTGRPVKKGVDPNAPVLRQLSSTYEPVQYDVEESLRTGRTFRKDAPTTDGRVSPNSILTEEQAARRAAGLPVVDRPDNSILTKEQKRRQLMGLPVDDMTERVADLKDNILSDKSRDLVEGYEAGKIPGYAAGPTGLRIAQERAAWGVPQPQAPRYTPDPANVAAANQALVEANWRRADTVDGGDMATKEPRVAAAAPAKNAYTNKPQPYDTSMRGLTLEAAGTRTVFGSQEAAKQRPMTAAERKRSLDTPQAVDFGVADIAAFNAGAAQMPEMEDGQTIQTSEGRFFKKKSGMLIPHIIDDTTGELVPRDQLLQEWAKQNGNDPDARAITKAFQARGAALQNEAEGKTDKQSTAQVLERADAALEAASRAIQARGGFALAQQAEQSQEKPLTPSEVNTLVPRTGDTTKPESMEEYRARVESAKQKKAILEGTEEAPPEPKSLNETGAMQSARDAWSSVGKPYSNVLEGVKGTEQFGTVPPDMLDRVTDEVMADPKYAGLPDEEIAAEVRRRLQLK